jgi:hypothetical protein
MAQQGDDGDEAAINEKEPLVEDELQSATNFIKVKNVNSKLENKDSQVRLTLTGNDATLGDGACPNVDIKNNQEKGSLRA